MLYKCVFQFVNHYAIILRSPEVLPVDVITCTELSDVTHTHTDVHTLPRQSLVPCARVKRTLSRSNAALYLDATTESDAA